MLCWLIVCYTLQYRLVDQVATGMTAYLVYNYCTETLHFVSSAGTACLFVKQHEHTAAMPSFDHWYNLASKVRLQLHYMCSILQEHCGVCNKTSAR